MTGAPPDNRGRGSPAPLATPVNDDAANTVPDAVPSRPATGSLATPPQWKDSAAPGGPRPPGRPPRGLTAPHKIAHRWLLWLGVSALGLFALTALGGFLAYQYFASELPAFDSLDQYRPPITTRFYAADRRIVGEFAEERRTLVHYDRIPKKLALAFISAEDSEFFEHAGINPLAIGRAFFANLKAGRTVQGGSTISQQVAKTFVGREKTYKRKIRELILTFRIEQTFEKRDILWFYLNQIYLGHGAYGVEAAAQNYYGKHVWELTLAEMAVLAGLPQAPSAYDPWKRPEAARDRQLYVLRRMFEEGHITAAERDEASREKVVVKAIHDYFRDEAPYFTEHVRRHIADRYGFDALYKEGLQVHMTMDLDGQLAAESALINGVRRVDKRQGWRGPLMNLPQAEWSRFAEKYAAHIRPDDLKDGETHNPGFDTIYTGVVTGFEGSRNRKTLVTVGAWQAVIPLENMAWAHPVGYGMESARIDDPEKAVKPGDVILVRLDRPEKGEGEAASRLRDNWKAKVSDGRYVMRLEQIPNVQGALVSAAPGSGYVKAMIGGYDFRDSEFNRAFQACRQPGSAFKPVVYSAAVEQLNYTPSTIIIDSPIVFDDPSNDVRWRPANYEEDHKGDVPLRLALVHSMNLPAIKILQAVGVDNAIAHAKKLGIRHKELNRDLSIALGSSCVTLWELTNVYALFDNQGVRPNLKFISKIIDRDGKYLEFNVAPDDMNATFRERLWAGVLASMTPAEQVIPKEDAFLMTYLMGEVARFGTAAAAQALNQPVAGKTGTTNDAFDAWFMGYTPSLVTGVWVGFDTYEYPLGKWETGGKAALPIWLEYMRAALFRYREKPWRAPEGIVSLIVDPNTGLRAAGGNGVQAYFKKGTAPEETAKGKGELPDNELYRYEN